MNMFALLCAKITRLNFSFLRSCLQGEPTENVDDILSLLVNRYNVTEYEVI